jgi:hypothetical protein
VQHSASGHGGTGRPDPLSHRPDPLSHRLDHAPRQSCPASAASGSPSSAVAPVLPGPSAAVEDLPSARMLPDGEAASAVPHPRHTLPQPPPAAGRLLPQGPASAPHAEIGAEEDEANGAVPPVSPFSSVAASTYLPLGMGMSLIGFGVALVGLRLRRR